MKSGWRIGVAALLLGLVCGCAVWSGGICRIDEKQAGQVVPVVCGETVVLQLSANPTTGYNWSFTFDLAGSRCTTDRAETFLAPDTGRCGAPGMAEFRFRAERPGRAVLRCVYRRPWEAAPPDAKVLEYIFNITEKP